MTIRKAMINESGRLTLKFLRRVIVPPFFKGKGREDDMEEVLNEMFKFNIESVFFASEAEEFMIMNLELIEYTEK